jgi:hypothetical protein
MQEPDQLKKVSDKTQPIKKDTEPTDDAVSGASDEEAINGYASPGVVTKHSAGDSSESSPVWDMARTGDSYTHPALGESILREYIRNVLKN